MWLAWYQTVFRPILCWMLDLPDSSGTLSGCRCKHRFRHLPLASQRSTAQHCKLSLLTIAAAPNPLIPRRPGTVRVRAAGALITSLRSDLLPKTNFGQRSIHNSI